MNVLLLTSHSIAEYDDLRMLTDLGYNVFSIGAYTDPAHPTDDKRPPLTVREVPLTFPGLAALCQDQRVKHGGEGAEWAIDWAKADLHPDIVEWADAIIVHHFPERWIAGQWDRIKHKRVIWRTCGQSGPDGSLERLMAELVGLQIVRYSPRERVIPGFAGEDALIRFGKYPADYGPWTGDEPVVINITQHLAQRGEAVGYSMWQEATRGVTALALGPGSEVLGGPGALTYDEMRSWLTRARAYVYTGTKPASYTLGLIEAMLSGIPVVVMTWDVPAPLSQMYEAQDIVPRAKHMAREAAPTLLKTYLSSQDEAGRHGEEGRQAALDLFDVATVGPQWKAFLG